ncbi:MAG: hypothetical protein AW07_01654 [Candidatus Accumulibacter sp. SK-11]|nr:MAG: hypothetical protein AW07_01654 [Candidatus Accumulibacter sp. SK-11]
MFTVLVVQGSVAMEEGAAADILTRNSHPVTGHEQRGVGQVLGHSPVDRQFALTHQPPVIDDLPDPAVQREVRWNRRQPLGEPAQLGDRHLGIAVLDVARREERRPVDGHRVLVTGDHRVVEQFATVEVCTIVGDHLVRPLRSQNTLGDELVGVELARSRVLLDLLVHQRLRHHRLVLLVVPELAVADDVDHDVLPEGLAVLHGDAGDQRDCLGVVTIDMEDRRLGHLEDVGAVERRAIVARV